MSLEISKDLLRQPRAINLVKKTSYLCFHTKRMETFKEFPRTNGHSHLFQVTSCLITVLGLVLLKED